MKATGFLLFSILWLMLVGLSFYYQVEDDKKYGQKIAYKQAEMFFQHIVLMRQWNADHGGVYVPVTEQNQPNPYLNATTRDVTTREGQTLTLIDPALMTRQLAKMEESRSHIRFHIASLTPMDPENKADAWEEKALQAFTQGWKSYEGLTDIGNQRYFRYMGALVLEPTCLKCHNEPDYKVGDVVGGISVSIPSASIDDFLSVRLAWLKQSHLLIAAIGLMALLIAYWAQERLNKRLTKARSHLQLAYLDSLTLLPNRRYYDAFVRREWKRATRHHYPLSMIMIDIDFFKAYNDNLGHVEGDQCLRQVARTLRRYFRRSGDLIARYGGEEFCVVAACDSLQIMQLAEILRMAVESMKLPHPESKISQYVTISLGVATLIPRENIEFGDLLLHADRALYDAKHSGRNRVEKYRG
ncbi:diguanylate cyclase [Methylomonas methanica]|uniref:diguanylate cyclase n=1 Tax=Methylomonas methanica (strain DSM 25384 / MC09) TaxID=857087 RepID=G0A7D3_METMM|nr:diguanylate cyclase [Methylomonas methanica]AEG00603.1 diguanylate cyclase [Methylomonas methanica MC09]